MHKRLTPEETAKIRKLRESNLTMDEIATKTGRSLSAIQRACRGMSTRPPGGVKKTKMTRAGRAESNGTAWQGQLQKLVTRIRKSDPGVTAIEIDMTNGRYTVNRTSSERGEIQ